MLFVLITGALWPEKIAVLTGAQLLAALVWGLRLGSYLISRERSIAYQDAVRDQTNRSQSLHLVARVGIWISVSLLFVLCFHRLLFGGCGFIAQRETKAHRGNRYRSDVAPIDYRGCSRPSEIATKSVDPNAFANDGLYWWVISELSRGDLILVGELLPQLSLPM